MNRPKQYILTIKEGPKAGEVLILENIEYTLGRTPDNRIVIDELSVSRHHARLQPTLGSFALEDLGSTNGTWVNGEQLARPCVLAPGDIIQLADNVTLEFNFQEEILPEALIPPPDVPVTTETPRGKTPAWLTDKEPKTMPTRPKRLGYRVLIGVLLLLIVLCLAVTAYIWFAAPEVWQQILSQFGVPTP
ncbi:MAG TPA: FHA domain-containing protein [Anaerolineae bacterium]|nr:FHA domain-containing protein [Anaerolineae bacterium]